MTYLNPYLIFDGNCREAMELYSQVLGGTLSIQTVGESPVKENFSDSDHLKVMHAYLESGDIKLMASDYLGHGEFKHGNNVALSLNTSSKEETERIFSALSEGGVIEMPLEEAFWGDFFGGLRDKYGITWMINCAKSQN